MPVFDVILDAREYWAHPSKKTSFEVANELRFYSTDEFMRLVRVKAGKNGEPFFQLSTETMRFFFEKDKPDLEMTGTSETGDPFTSAKATHYKDSKTGNTWTLEHCSGGGTYGVNGFFYYYHSNGCTFKSNDNLSNTCRIE